ncbi:MAG: hypothetical protein O7B99_00130 [Planctomycetota bacterium]|nr:hypothetical protein [Planctomycetota bacterium]
MIRPLHALAVSLLLAAPLASAGSQGGTYSGPGDTVPTTKPRTGGNGIPPPDGTGGGGYTGPATGGPGPLTGGPAPVGPTPGEGMPLPTPPDEPKTPGARPPRADAASWQLWWYYNRWGHLPVGRAQELLASSGSSDFFLGRGQRKQESSVLRASAEDVRTWVQPNLLQMLESGGRAELVVQALHALAKLRDMLDQTGRKGWDKALRHHLRDGNQDISEKAVLAIGIRGMFQDFELLSNVLADNTAGRELLGRSRVGSRHRSYAAYALGLMAHRNPDAALRTQIFRRLSFVLEDERPEVQAAALTAIGFTALPTEAPFDATSAPPELTCTDQVERVLEFFLDRHASTLARSQAPFALALLLENAPEPLRERTAHALMDATGPRSSMVTELRNGAVIALGTIGRSGPEPIDVEIRRFLERTITGPGANRLTRYLASIALAEVSRRPGAGTDEYAGLAPTRRFLLRQFARSRGQTQAWNALALGVLEENAHERGSMPSADTALALRQALKQSRSGDVVGAVALAIGMLRDIESREILIDRVESGNGVLRGYAALALGMVGVQDALGPLRTLLARSSNRPGTLQRTAIGLSLLGDAGVSQVLSAMLERSSRPEVQASIAAALGWVKDPRLLPQLGERLVARGVGDSPRAWTAVAVGRICDRDLLPWNSLYSVGANYDVTLPTLIEPDYGTGLLDLP